MRIIFLNIWEGKLQEAIESFILGQAPATDVFCLEEVPEGTRRIFEKLLPNYKGIYADKSVLGHTFEQATYVRDSIGILISKPLLETTSGVGLGLYTQLVSGVSKINICNLHGVSHPGDKLDNPDRMEQSKAVIDFFKTFDGQKIIGGDFNLLPETESIKMFEENGYVDLIKKFDVKTTRNHLAWDRYDIKQYFSDYAFTSEDVKIKSFEVINNEISDHLPLILDVED